MLLRTYLFQSSQLSWDVRYSSRKRNRTLRENQLSKRTVSITSEVHRTFLCWVPWHKVRLYLFWNLLEPIKCECLILSHCPGSWWHFRWRQLHQSWLWREDIGEQSLRPVYSGLVVWARHCCKPLSLGDVCYCTIAQPFLKQIVPKPVSWQGWNLNLRLSDPNAIAFPTVSIVSDTMFWGHMNCLMVRPQNSWCIDNVHMEKVTSLASCKFPWFQMSLLQAHFSREGWLNDW